MSQRATSGRRVKRQSFVAVALAAITMMLASLGFAQAAAAPNVPSGIYTGPIGQSTERTITFPVSNGHIGEIEAQTYMYCGGWPVPIWWGDNPAIAIADDGTFNAEYWFTFDDPVNDTRFRISGSISSDGVATGELKVHFPNLPSCVEGTEPFTATLETPIYDPDISVVPDSVTQSELATAGVEVTGSDFPASSSISLTIDGTDAGSATTDANGAFTATATAALEPGSYTVTASAGSTSATASLTVVADPVDPVDPTLSVSPTTLTVDELTREGIVVTGADFPASSTVGITIGGADAGSVDTDADGSFSTTAYATLAPGSHTVVAAVGDVSASETITVTENPAEPELTVDPSTLTASELAADGILVSGTGFPTDGDVDITIGDVSVGTTTADSSGDFSLNVTGDFEPNTYTVAATSGSVSSTATLTVVPDEVEPVLAVQPDEVTEEELRTDGIVVSGTDFPALSDVQITIGDDEVATATTDASGVFSQNVTADVAAATYTVTATSGDASASASLTVIAEAWAPELDVSPTELTQTELAEDGIEITATGFRPDEVLTIEWDGDLWHEITTDENGSASVTLTRDDVTPGEYEVTARQSWIGGGGWLSALQTLDTSVTITVTEDSPTPADPELEVESDTVTVSDLASGFALSGSGFTPGEELTIEFGGETVETTVADEEGAFTTTLALDGIEPGEYVITVLGASGSASVTVTVIADEPEPSEPQIELEKSTVSASELAEGITVTGSGFAPGEELTIEFDGEFVATITAEDDGTLAGSLSVENVEPGEYIITISGDSGAASATLTVTADTVDPEPSAPSPTDPEPSDPGDDDSNRDDDGDDDHLPQTGFDGTLGLLGLAAVAMFGGALLTGLRRRGEG